ncbi:MAG TPA: TonB-dependent receptor [Bryobacteraceae bacterium]|nr:TonB-dependent receptor [Bryobacteraceae bacterium]
MKKKASLSTVSIYKLAALALTAACAWGQVGTGAIRGAITDPSGAVVPGAQVVVKNEQTGVAMTLTANTDGRYVAPNLLVGSYDVQVQAQGFETAVRQNIVLAVGEQREVNVTLAVGQMTQEVAVQESAAAVDTSTSTVSGLINQQQMRDLPLNGRNFEQLIALTPGTVPVTNAANSAYIGRSITYSYGGARPVGQEEMIDGQDIQDFWGHGSGAAVLGTSLGVDAIAEFQTYTSTASAQFGGANGGLNAVTRSGTNDLHGSVYYFARNSIFDADPYFVPSTGKPPFERNQYGGTIGGPIKKNKMFFFGNYEGLRQTLGESSVVILPNQAAQNEVQSYIGTLVPGSSQYNAEKLVLGSLQAVPTPNAGAINLGNGTSQEVVSGNQTGLENYVVGRWDYTVDAKDTIWFRIIYDRATLSEPYAANSVALYPQAAFDHNQFENLGWTRNISSSLINQAQFNFTRTAQVGNTPETIPAFACNPKNTYDCWYSTPGPSNVFGLVTPNAPIFDYIQNKYEERDQLIWVKGAHSIQIGGWVTRQQTLTSTPVNPGGNYYFSAWGYSAGGTPTANSFLTGQPYQFVGALPGFADSVRNFRETDLIGFIQDDWKARKNLTLNLGLRYSWATNPYDVSNDLYAFIQPYAADPAYVNVPHAFSQNPNGTNWDPRVGLAWAPFSDNKTVVRAGAGIIHYLYQPRDYGVGYNFGPPFDQVQVAFPAFSIPVQFVCTASAAQCTPTQPSIHDAMGYNITTTPYVIQYSANVQREIKGGIVVSGGIIASESSHLLDMVELNPQMNSGTTQNPVFSTEQLVNGAETLVSNPRINPNFGMMGEIMPWAHASYHAVQFQANKSLTHGFQFSTSYTNSRCYDDGSGAYAVDGGGGVSPLPPYPLSRNNGNCSFDRRNNFTFNAVYELPFHGHRLTEGWQIANLYGFHTGLPFTVVCGFDCLGLGEQNSANYVNINSGVNPGSVVQPGNINHYFKTADFNLQPLGTLGNENRFMFYGPSLSDDDLALVKNTRIHENMNLQIRVEAFNLANHPNFSNPGTSLYTGPTSPNPNAGKITSTISAQGGLPSSRQLQFAMRFQF